MGGNLAMAFLGAGIGAGLATIGAGIGIGRLSAGAMEGTSRQPSVAGNIFTLTMITAGMVEGVALFAVVICLLLSLKS
jgi:F-type H+-transporting ATPase subunit c